MTDDNKKVMIAPAEEIIIEPTEEITIAQARDFFRSYMQVSVKTYTGMSREIGIGPYTLMSFATGGSMPKEKTYAKILRFIEREIKVWQKKSLK